jgi:hypothetical protein
MDAGSSQARRLRDLLEAKQEHDAAIARIDECVAEGLLSAAEAADQRGLASRALMAAKANAGVAEDGREGNSGARWRGASGSRMRSVANGKICTQVVYACERVCVCVITRPHTRVHTTMNIVEFRTH